MGTPEAISWLEIPKILQMHLSLKTFLSLTTAPSWSDYVDVFQGQPAENESNQAVISFLRLAVLRRERLPGRSRELIVMNHTQPLTAHRGSVASLQEADIVRARFTELLCRSFFHVPSAGERLPAGEFWLVDHFIL